MTTRYILIFTRMCGRSGGSGVNGAFRKGSGFLFGNGYICCEYERAAGKYNVH